VLHPHTGMRKGSALSKRTVAAVAIVALAAMFFAMAQARAESNAKATSTYLVKATLDARHEVPIPKGARAATGVLTAKLVVAGKKSSFVWQLRFSRLSGRATASHVHYGALGKAGPIALPLCVPCVSPAHGEYRGSYVASPAFLKAILHGGAYVNLHTKLNPKGEIRGQIKATASS
jgi:CHRD domain